MANCDIQDGRLHDDCLDSVAGIKTVFFFKHNNLNVVKNMAGEITSIGTGLIYRFEQDQYHGLVVQEINRGQDLTQYVRFQIDFTMFYITPEFLYTINHIKNGLWAIFYLDYENKIRLLGEWTPMQQNGGVDDSGQAAGDTFWANLSFSGESSAYAPYLEDFTTYPFDNMTGILVSPPYGALPGLLIYNDAGEHYETDVFGNRLDYS
jgi:hypothetical protein